MRFEVVWLRFAHDDLTNIWIKSRSREMLQETLSDLEGKLSVNPISAGESRGGNRRIVFLDEIIAEFLVDVENSKVFVVRLHPRKTK
jgi:hypothetical protein